MFNNLGAEINNKKSKERQRKKTRYTEEDLFKPRSGLGRRRKIWKNRWKYIQIEQKKNVLIVF